MLTPVFGVDSIDQAPDARGRIGYRAAVANPGSRRRKRPSRHRAPACHPRASDGRRRRRSTSAKGVRSRPSCGVDEVGVDDAAWLVSARGGPRQHGRRCERDERREPGVRLLAKRCNEVREDRCHGSLLRLRRYPVRLAPTLVWAPVSVAKVPPPARRLVVLAVDQRGMGGGEGRGDEGRHRRRRGCSQSRG